MKSAYLDNAATTLNKPVSVRRAVCRAIGQYSSPGRGGYPSAMAAAELCYACRLKAASLFHAEAPENVVFTMNATHGLNIAIKSLVKRGMRVAVSGYEHNAVMRPLRKLGAEVNILRTPLFDQAAAVRSFDEALEEGCELVVCCHVSNVFGFVLPAEKIAALCRVRGVPFILDASQSAGAVTVNMNALDAAYIAMPGHKGLYGPQGTGLLLCSQVPEPLMEGGTGSNSASDVMPDFLPDAAEAGTHNMPGIAGLNAGLAFVAGQGTERILTHERRLIASAAEGLRRMGGLRVFCAEEGSAQAGVLSFIPEAMPSEMFAEELSRREVSVRAGLHCAPEAHRTAGTMGTGTVRLSVSAMTTEADIGLFLRAVSEVFKKK